MSKNKCCGNCKHFKDEDVNGFGQCGKDGVITKCNTFCSDYSSRLNGWTEITPDNVDEIDAIDPNRLVIATMIEGIVFSSVRADSDITLKSCSELGGYYSYVLPELKLDE